MATKGKGAKAWLWDAAAVPAALVKLGEVTSIKPPQPSRDTIDTTSHDSTGDYREFISSLIDAGEASFTINYNPGSPTETLVNAAFAAGDLRGFAIDLNAPGGGAQRRIAGSAIVTGFAPDDVVIDDKMSATITLKVSGPLTFGDTPAP